MPTFAVTNWTKRKTSRPYPSEEAALNDLPNVLSPGDEYDVWHMPEVPAAAGTVVRTGVWSTRSR